MRKLPIVKKDPSSDPEALLPALPAGPSLDTRQVLVAASQVNGGMQPELSSQVAAHSTPPASHGYGKHGSDGKVTQLPTPLHCAPLLSTPPMQPDAATQTVPLATSAHPPLPSHSPV